MSQLATTKHHRNNFAIKQTSYEKKQKLLNYKMPKVSAHCTLIS